MYVIASNRPFEIEYRFMSKETHPTKVVIVFWTLVYEPPKCAKTKHEYWATLDINWTEKYQLHHVTSACWFDLPMPILFSYEHLFSVFLIKIFFLLHQWNGHKMRAFASKNWNLSQMKANKIIFILVFSQCHTIHGSKVMTN